MALVPQMHVSGARMFLRSIGGAAQHLLPTTPTCTRSMSRWHAPRLLIPVEEEYRLAPLPYRMQLGNGIRMVLDKMQPQHKPDIMQIIESSMADDLGTGPEDFAHQSLSDYLDECLTLSMVDEDSGKPFGVITQRGSTMCRSQWPVAHEGFLVVAREYRGGHVFPLISVASAVGCDVGYLGNNVRVHTRSPVINAGWSPGYYMTATLHRGAMVPKRGFLPNVLVHNSHEYRRDYSEVRKQMEIQRLSEPLPPLKYLTEVPPFLRETLSIQPKMKELASSENITFESASDSSIWEMEKTIREMAQKGDYFAMDEFTDEGWFNRRGLRKTHVISAVTSSGTLGGAAIFGPCASCRSKLVPNARLYMFVAPESRERGIGNALLEEAMRTIEDMGYQGISSDIFPNCHVGSALLRKRGFVLTGSLQKCACVKGLGFTDSLLFYKDLKSITLEM